MTQHPLTFTSGDEQRPLQGPAENHALLGEDWTSRTRAEESSGPDNTEHVKVPCC